MTLEQRILTIVDRNVGVSRDELAYQLERRGGAVTDGSLAIAVDQLLTAGTLVESDSGIYSRARAAA